MAKSSKKVVQIWSHPLHLHWKLKLWEEKFAWCVKAKHCWVLSTIILGSSIRILCKFCTKLKEKFCSKIEIFQEYGYFSFISLLKICFKIWYNNSCFFNSQLLLNTTAAGNESIGFIRKVRFLNKNLDRAR